MLLSPLPSGLSEDVLRSYRAHRAAECWYMLALGVVQLGDAVLRKSLAASDFQVTLFATALLLPSLLAGVWGLWMEGRQKRPVFVVTGVVRFLLLGVLVLSEHPYWFIGVFLVSTLMEPVFLTAQSSLYQSNYPSSVRATLVGRVGAIGRVAYLAGALVAGDLLDRFPGHGTWILAGAGIVGFGGTWCYAGIPFTRPRASIPPVGTRSLYARLFGDLHRILRENPAFDRYERNYFLYGLAFMMLLPVNVFLLVDAFRVSYKEFSLIKMVALQVGFMLSLPAWGRSMDRGGPYGTAAAAFLMLTLYPAMLSLGVATHRSEYVWLAFFLFGVCMAGVHMTWTLSSVHFARGRDSSSFMGIHIFCVGVRGLLGPFLGLRLYQWAGYHAAFGASLVLFFVAGILMKYSPDRREVEAWGHEDPPVAPPPEPVPEPRRASA